MDEVQDSGEEIVITKHGKPVSKLVPCREPKRSLWGLHRDQIHYDENDDLLSTGEAWEAEQG